MVAPFAGIVGAQESGPPSGMVGVPSENVGPPDHAQGGGNGGGPPGGVELPESVPTDAAAWSVHASKHAGDLGVTIGEVSGSPALVFSDDVNHDGREVAVDAMTLEETLGDRPTTAYGLHEDGSEWTSPISYENGMAVFEVPRFSSNTVTFDGEITLTGSPAENGTAYSYELADSEQTDNLTVTLTGNENRINHTQSYTEQTNGNTFSHDVDGTTAPEAATVSLKGTLTPGTGKEQWENLYGERVWHTEVSGTGETVFAGLGDGTVKALDSDGNEVWSASTGGQVTGMDYGENNLYVVDAVTDSVVAINPDDGSEEWNISISSPQSVEYDGKDGVVYTGTQGGVIHELDAVDGTENWQTTAHSSRIRGIDTDSTTVYSGGSDETVTATKKSDQSEVWKISHNTTVSGVNVENGTVYSSLWNGSVAAHSASDGSFDSWMVNSEERLTGVISPQSSDLIYATSTDNRLYALYPGDNGRIVWDFRIAENTLYDADSDDSGSLYVGARDGSVTKIKDGDESIDPSVALDGTTIASHSGRLAEGETVTEPISVALGVNDFSVGSTDGSAVDVTLEVEEITETVDPSVVINGDTYDYFGVLADNETTELDVSTASLTNGSNTVDVVVSESYDGPVGQMGLDYSHSAASEQEVDYASEAYSERYNVSKTFAADQEDATLTIPFASTVVDVRQLETRTNGGTWSTVSSSNYELDNSSLVVDLGNVAAEDTVEVRTTATKVRVTDGSITVTDPTVLGDGLATEIRLEEIGSNFGIGVSSTAYDDEFHYTYSESWSNSQSYAHVENDGTQELKFPNAGAGATTRLGTIDLGVNPESGAADVRITKSGSEPEFVVRESSTAESIDFEWRETTSGHVYQLYSQTADGEVDRGEASSPVTLTYSGSGGETLAIFDLGTGGTNAGGGGGGGVTSSSTSPILLILAIVGGLAGLYLVSRRTGDDSISGMALFAVGAVVMGILGMQALAPRILADWIGRGISEALPLVLLAGAAIAIVWLRQRGNDTNLTFRLGGNR